MPDEVKNNEGGSSVTWKWVAGIALAGVISLGAAAARDLNNRQESSASDSNRRISNLEVDVAQSQVREDIHYREIQRQLSELQRSIDQLANMMHNRRF